MNADAGQRLADCEVAVQTAIDAGDWAGAARLEAGFREMLAAAVAAMRDDPSADSGRLRAILESATTRVARLIGECAHHERRLVREATMLSVGRQASAAYTDGDKIKGIT